MFAIIHSISPQAPAVVEIQMKRLLGVVLLMWIAAVSAHAQDYAAQIKSLASRLHWHNETEHEKYDAFKVRLTGNLLNEIDNYISKSFKPNSATPEQIKAGLDAILDHKKGGLPNNIVFFTDLPSGRFLVVGIEVERGGEAIPDDAISFRSYAESGDRFVHVASTRDLSTSPLIDLNAKPIVPSPENGEFWFIAWADVPPQSPYTVAVRMYAFNGTDFRVIWAPRDIIALHVDNAVRVDQGDNIVISRLPDWKSFTVLHEHYEVTSNGPIKATEWTTDEK